MTPLIDRIREEARFINWTSLTIVAAMIALAVEAGVFIGGALLRLVF